MESSTSGDVRRRRLQRECVRAAGQARALAFALAILVAAMGLAGALG